MTRYRSVVLDVDSTVSAIEGIDWLAELRGPSVATEIAALTTAAMNNEVPLDAVYGRRLGLIRPTHREIATLGAEYIATAVPGVRDAVALWLANGITVVLVSGGLRAAILPLAAWLSIPSAQVFAVDLEFDADGVASGVAPGCVLARAGGKPRVVAALPLARPILAVGDGATDAELAGVVDRFVAFTGVVRRPAVVERADGDVATFTDLIPIVLGVQHAQ